MQISFEDVKIGMQIRYDELIIRVSSIRRIENQICLYSCIGKGIVAPKDANVECLLLPQL